MFSKTPKIKISELLLNVARGFINMGETIERNMND